MGTKRTTISLNTADWKMLQALATQAGQSLSSFLVSRAVGPRLENFNIHSVDTIRNWLLKGSYPPDERSRLEKEAPGIAEAVTDFESAATIHGREFISALDSSQFIPQLVPYPISHRNETTKFQEELLAELSSLEDIGSRESLGFEGYLREIPGSERNQALVAHHFVRPGLVGSKPVIYLFPFFRPNNRRPLWGVIDYAQHKYIGLLLNKKIFAGTLRDSSFREDMSEVPESRAYAWLGKQVIEVLCKNGTKKNIGFREGFFESEIAEVLWSKAQSHLRFYAFERYRMPYSADELEPALKDDSCGILVVDLLHVKSLDNPNWQLVRFPHHADVPVGIGFTMSLLPRLIVHNNWSILKKKANQLIADGFGEVLAECGIEVNAQD